jgi:hypothetical protein
VIMKYARPTHRFPAAINFWYRRFGEKFLSCYGNVSIQSRPVPIPLLSRFYNCCRPW